MTVKNISYFTNNGQAGALWDESGANFPLLPSQLQEQTKAKEV